MIIYQKFNEILMKILEKKYEVKINANIERKWVQMKKREMKIVNAIDSFTEKATIIIGYSFIIFEFARLIIK